MSRLYYAEDPAAFAAGGGGQAKEYLEKVAKLVPSEVVAGYLTLVGLVSLIGDEALHQWFYWGIFALGLVLTPLYLNQQADKDKPRPTVHLGLSFVAFIFWAYATSGGVVVPELYDAAIASILLGAFSLVSGLIPLS